MDDDLVKTARNIRNISWRLNTTKLLKMEVKMINFKQEIAKSISKAIKIEDLDIEKSIEIPKEKKQGDYAFPCFKLAKILKKSPLIIAEEIKNNIKFEEELISKIEIVGGYLNFFVKKEILAKTVVEDVNLKKDEYGKSNIGNRKKYYCRIFFSQYCKTIPYRAFKDNINWKCTIQYI